MCRRSAYIMVCSNMFDRTDQKFRRNFGERMTKQIWFEHASEIKYDRMVILLLKYCMPINSGEMYIKFIHDEMDLSTTQLLLIERIRTRTTFYRSRDGEHRYVRAAL